MWELHAQCSAGGKILSLFWDGMCQLGLDTLIWLLGSVAELMSHLPTWCRCAVQQRGWRLYSSPQDSCCVLWWWLDTQQRTRNPSGVLFVPSFVVLLRLRAASCLCVCNYASLVFLARGIWSPPVAAISEVHLQPLLIIIMGVEQYLAMEWCTVFLL